MPTFFLMIFLDANTIFVIVGIMLEFIVFFDAAPGVRGSYRVSKYRSIRS